MALNIISILKKKTLILVHKEFLMNQWIERIAEFMPSARVGKIQGPVFDVEGRDIVIGMIQTMHSRDFEASAFDPFGLTVIDEVHRIGSEEFSKTLFKVVTPYMLGISATVERKDRLTRILYMFIGPKIYSEERTDDDIVQVRAIMFKTRDPEFNQTEYDFRGSPKYSTMISKLCAFGPRSDFIIRILSDLLKENPHKQIMVLAHNRDLLTFLYDAIRHHISAEENIVGYYVGGMKEKDLKITEGRRIVLATYAMAAEALDIKTLSTLVMATPKTDIEQSVGRILRAKGQNPIVVDILDSHEYLKRQWNTRRLFYKKCNYRITSTDIDGYTGFENMDKWRLEYDPATANKEAKEKKKCLINIPKEILEAEVV
jgi:superfamily II DNA or RNA helicase